MKKGKNYLIIITFTTILFLISIILDLTPLLRGPAPYPPEWQYAYYFLNTVGRIWLPFIIAIILLLFGYKMEIKDVLNQNKNEKYIIGLLIIFAFFFQLSVLFFSRAGVGVLLQRVLDPGMNGYFTASLQIEDIGQYLTGYNNNVLNLFGHARGHPPGGIIFIWIMNKLFSYLPFLYNFVNSFSPSSESIKKLWFSLNEYEKVSAASLGFILSFLSGLTVIPVYYLGKYLYNAKIAFRASLLYIFIPSFILFIPMYDIIFPVFSSFALLLFVKGLDFNLPIYMFLSGLIIFAGIFFSLSLIPIVLMLLFIFLIKYFKSRILIFPQNIILGLYFLLGLLFLPVILFVMFNFNFLEVTSTIMSGLAPRSYALWLSYNLYDFFIFSGIPVLIVFIYALRNFISLIIKKSYNCMDFLFLSFFLTLFILDISGICRAETSRIWLPFMPVLALITAKYLSRDLNFSKNFFLIFLALQFLQILVMQEFWVMLW